MLLDGQHALRAHPIAPHAGGLGVSYTTAWLVKHKLMQTMLVREAPRRLTDRVEIDDAYLGGERVGETPGRGSPNKVPLVAAVQTELTGKPHVMRLTAVAGFTQTALADWAAHALAPDAHVVSDGLWCFEAVTTVPDTTHERRVVDRSPQAVKRPECRWVNTMLGNAENSLGWVPIMRSTTLKGTSNSHSISKQH